MFPPFLRLDAVSDYDNPALCARDCALNCDEIILTIDLYDLQILNGNLLCAHVARHALALVDTGRRGACAHGTGPVPWVSFSLC